MQRIIKRLRLTIQPNVARSRISYQKAQGVGPAEIAARMRDSRIMEQQEFVTVYRGYEMTLAASNLLDYDDLLLRCADLLRRFPHCVSNVQAVLVDEFQDTNHIQYELMNLLASRRKRITVVGDPDQSIYGFRSAEIRNLSRMQRLYRNTSVVLLENNYRSSGAILSSAQDVIEQDVSRPAKKLQPTHCAGTLPVLRKLPTAAAEAEWLVFEIKRCIAMTGRLLNYSDFAVLLRSASLSRQVESEMGKGGVPYRMVGGSRFFDRVEIKLLLDYLRVVSHTGNSDALLRIINAPPRSVGETTVQQLTGGAEEANVPVWNYVKDVAQGHRSTKKSLSKSTDHGLRNFVGLIETCRQKLVECEDGTAPRTLLEHVIKKLSFREYLTAAYPLDEENRWANVEELLCQAEDTAAPGNATAGEEEDRLPEIQGISQQQTHPGEEALSRFLANVALSSEVTTEEDEQANDDNNNQQIQGKVTISTIHAAKGLEWPVVFVPAVYNGIIPHSRAEDADEERRLLYVAMTRAQAMLYLSYPRRQQSRVNNNEETSPTPFLPSNIADARFRPVGPNFHEPVVFEIADILHRPRPSVDSMLRGLTETPRVSDDKWTETGEEPPDAVFGTTSSGPMEEKGPCPKRRRCERNPSTTTTTYMSSSAYTLSNPSNFSVPATTLPSGFSTARDYITSHPHNNNNPTTKPDRTDDSTKKKTADTSNTRKAPTTGLSQGNIFDFFSGKSRNAPDRSKPTTQTRTQTQTQTDTQTKSKPNANHITSNHHHHHHHRLLQPHRLLPPSRPVLEPSDPNPGRYPWLASSSPPAPAPAYNPAETPPSPTSPLRKPVADSNTKISPQKGNVNRDDVETGNGKRTTTYYNTTMSMLRRPESGSSFMGRKTLGVRRGMNNGWEERMNRERLLKGGK